MTANYVTKGGGCDGGYDWGCSGSMEKKKKTVKGKGRKISEMVRMVREFEMKVKLK